MAALEITGPARTAADGPLALRLRGGGPGADVVWRARLRDDEGRVWRGTARTPEDLPAALRPQKASADPRPVPALLSLRPFALDVRAEVADGRSAARSVERVLLAEGVRRRRWRGGGLRATLTLPAAPPDGAAVLLTAGGDPVAEAAARLAAALLAGHGVACVELDAGDPGAAVALLAAVPSVTADPVVLAPAEVPVPAGIPCGGETPADADARAAAWAALVARLRGA